MQGRAWYQSSTSRWHLCIVCGNHTWHVRTMHDIHVQLKQAVAEFSSLYPLLLSRCSTETSWWLCLPWMSLVRACSMDAGLNAIKESRSWMDGVGSRYWAHWSLCEACLTALEVTRGVRQKVSRPSYDKQRVQEMISHVRHSVQEMGQG